jgi:hypothetical protein
VQALPRRQAAQLASAALTPWVSRPQLAAAVSQVLPSVSVSVPLLLLVLVQRPVLRPWTPLRRQLQQPLA